MKALHIDIGGTYTKISTAVFEERLVYTVTNRISTFTNKICDDIIDQLDTDLVNQCQLVLIGIPGVRIDGSELCTKWSLPHLLECIDIEKLISFFKGFNVELIVDNDALVLLRIASSIGNTTNNIMLTFGTSLGLAVSTTTINKSFELAHCHLLTRLEKSNIQFINILGIKDKSLEPVKYKDVYNGNVLKKIFMELDVSTRELILFDYYENLLLAIDNLLVIENTKSSFELHICGSFFYGEELRFSESFNRYLLESSIINRFSLKSINFSLLPC